MQTVRIQVETNDGCRTIWYETSRLKNPTEMINKRVMAQLAGLNLKRVEVSLSPATVWQFSKCPLGVDQDPHLPYIDQVNRNSTNASYRTQDERRYQRWQRFQTC